MDWICNKCGNPAKIMDADTMYLDFDGIQECKVCDTCKEWWFEIHVADAVRKGEADCEAKMG